MVIAWQIDSLSFPGLGESCDTSSGDGIWPSAFEWGLDHMICACKMTVTLGGKIPAQNSLAAGLLCGS